jgi:hypothetical protein
MPLHWIGWNIGMSPLTAVRLNGGALASDRSAVKSVGDAWQLLLQQPTDLHGGVSPA